MTDMVVARLSVVSVELELETLVTMTELVEVEVSRRGAPFSALPTILETTRVAEAVVDPTGAAGGLATGGEPPFNPTKYPHPPS